MPYRIQEKQTGRFVTGLGLSVSPSKAFIFDTEDEAHSELIWRVQHSDDDLGLPPGRYVVESCRSPVLAPSLVLIDE